MSQGIKTIIDDYVTPEEIRLIENLKGKSRMEQEQIIYEYERGDKNVQQV